HNTTAGAKSHGWYWTDADYSARSTTPTDYVVVRGPAKALDGGLVRPYRDVLIPTDLYYASLESPLYSQPGKHDWDLDDNGVYGGKWGGNPDGFDLVSDIGVARAPVRTAQQVEELVDKVLTYARFCDVRDNHRPPDRA